MRRFISSQFTELPAIVRLWLLRMLVPLGAQHKFIGRDEFYSDGLAELLGLGQFLKEHAFNKQAVRAALANLHRQAEAKSVAAMVPDVMRRNVARLAELVGVSELDCRILEFIVLLQIEPLLEETSDWLGYLSSVKTYRVLAGILDVAEPEIQLALSEGGLLARSGLVSIDRNGSNSLRGKLAACRT